MQPGLNILHILFSRLISWDHCSQMRPDFIQMTKLVTMISLFSLSVSLIEMKYTLFIMIEFRYYSYREDNLVIKHQEYQCFFQAIPYLNPAYLGLLGSESIVKSAENSRSGSFPGAEQGQQDLVMKRILGNLIFQIFRYFSFLADFHFGRRQS